MYLYIELIVTNATFLQCQEFTSVPILYSFFFFSFQKENDESSLSKGRKRAAPRGRGKGSAAAAASKRVRKLGNSSSIQKTVMNNDDEDEEEEKAKRLKKSQPRVSSLLHLFHFGLILALHCYIFSFDYCCICIFKLPFKRNTCTTIHNHWMAIDLTYDTCIINTNPD